MTSLRDILSFHFNPSSFGSLGESIIARSTEKAVQQRTDGLSKIASGAGSNVSIREHEQSSTLDLFHRAYDNDTLNSSFSARRNQKRLAFCLTIDHAQFGRIVSDEGRFAAALALLKPVRGAKVTWGVFMAMLECWAVPEVRKELARALNSRIYRDPNLLFHQLLKKNKEFLFIKRGAENLADHLLKQKIELRESMSMLSLPDHLHATQYALLVAQRYAVGLVRSKRNSGALIQWSEERKEKEYALAALPPLIVNASPGHRSALEKASLSLIGDPGVLGEWSSKNPALARQDKVIEAARQKVQGWLSERLITLFFSKLQLDDEERREYWARWAKHMSDIRIAVSWSNRHLLLSNEELAEYLEPRMITMRGTEATALVMKIKDRVVVEIGERNNALYVYPESKVPFMSSNSVSIHQLKDTSLQWLYNSSGYYIYNTKPSGRVFHRQGWQDYVDEWMREQLMIEP